MSAEPPSPPLADFDRFADDYDASLAEGLSVSGEDKEFFARGRVQWLAVCLRKVGVAPRQLLDFGCGTGASLELLLGLDAGAEILGVDVSARSLAVARRLHPSARVRLAAEVDCRETGRLDVAFCNGVFHHIALPERAEAVGKVFRALRPGGLFAFWENNPWNPGTRYVMSKVAFDRDAVTLSPPAARRLLREGGFEVLRSDFLFYFPRALAALRPIEPVLRKLPLGAQYQVLCRKPV